jgi:hypothetical protein
MCATKQSRFLSSSFLDCGCSRLECWSTHFPPEVIAVALKLTILCKWLW